MTSGGARARSGPPPDPSSGRSASRGLSLTALPSSGFQGDMPGFPLPELESAVLSDRELAVWAEAWSTPQACVWALESWRWPVVAEYCRLKVAVEAAPAANASLVTQLHRYREQLGLTPAGMNYLGWKIARDEVAEQRVAKASEPKGTGRMSARDRRLKAVGDSD